MKTLPPAQQHAYFTRTAGHLIGAQLVGFLKDDWEGDEGLTIVLEKDGQLFGLGVLRDPEGNGPGWLDLVPLSEEG